MPVLIDVATQDFPDGAQRFNWCNCQSEAPRLTRALGDVTPVAQSDLSAPLPVTPIFDFGFWDQMFTGGGSPIRAGASQVPSVLNPYADSGKTVFAVLVGAAAIGAAWMFTASRGKGRRR